MSVLQPGLLRQDGVCLARVHDLHQHVQRVTIRAEGDRECRGLLRAALHLSLFNGAAVPPDLMHQQEAAGRLVDVHDSVCADSVLVHQPAKLDEDPVRWRAAARGCEALSRTWGFHVAQVHTTQESLDPTVAGTGVESLCVQPTVHQASDGERAEAQDIGPRTSTAACSIDVLPSTGPKC